MSTEENTMSMTRAQYEAAGCFSLRKEKWVAHGRTIRIRRIVFTTHDGFVGESPFLNEGGHHRAAYEAAMAARAAAKFAETQAELTRLPTGAPCDKPAPAAPLPQYVLRQLKDTFLCDELERRGYEVSLA